MHNTQQRIAPDALLPIIPCTRLFELSQHKRSVIRVLAFMRLCIQWPAIYTSVKYGPIECLFGQLANGHQMNE